jgi:hypothetical protein
MQPETVNYPDAKGNPLDIGTIVTAGEGELEVIAFGVRGEGVSMVLVRDPANNASVELDSRVLTTIRTPFAPAVLRIDQSHFGSDGHGYPLFGIQGITLNGRPIPCLQEVVLRMADSTFATATFTVGVSADKTVLDYLVRHQFIATENEEGA